MYLDLNSLLSDEQAIVATAPSTNSYDLGAVGKTAYNSVQLKRNLGAGGKIPFAVIVNVAFNNLTSLQVDIESDDDSAFGSPTVIFSKVIALADLKQGLVITDFLPLNIKERYLRMNYTVVGAAPSLGKISAGVTTAVDNTYKG
jgi:hypothetical protein